MATPKQEPSAKDKQIARLFKYTGEIVAEQASTIAMNGLKPEDFEKVFREAILRSPDIIEAMNKPAGALSAQRAFRQCCKDGLLPDGFNAAMWAYKGEVSYLPMVDGLKRIIFEKLGADVDAGVIRACDKYTIKIVPGSDPMLEIVPLLDDKNADQTVIASWCYIKVPNETGKLYISNQKKIAAARAKSKTRGNDSAWNLYTEDMSIKVSVKHGARKLFHKVPIDSNLVSAVEYDDKEGEEFTGDKAKILDGEFEPMPEAEIETAPVAEDPDPEPAPATEPEPEPAPAQEAETVPEAQPEPKPKAKAKPPKAEAQEPPKTAPAEAAAPAAPATDNEPLNEDNPFADTNL